MTIGLRKAIQDSLGITAGELNRIILRAPYAYKIYTIQKKSGGVRTIAQPAKETKFIQHWLIRNLFEKLPVHQCAAAYQEGSSIKKNADAHKSNSYVTKFDFKDFFTSIKGLDLARHCLRYLGNSLTSAEIEDIVRISSIRLKGRDDLCLSIGAPSSPILSNTIMFDFDSYVHAWCIERKISYTRYADDLTFSTNVKGACVDIEPTIREIVRKLDYPTLRFNNKKTVHLSKKFQRRITGLIINNEGNISLGRERKRAISAQIHRFSLGLLSEDDTFKLQGLLGFARDVEPLFLARMRAKYGGEVIEVILQKRKK